MALFQSKLPINFNFVSCQTLAQFLGVEFERTTSNLQPTYSKKQVCEIRTFHVAVV